MTEVFPYDDVTCVFCGERVDPAEAIEIEPGLWACEACAVEEYGAEILETEVDWWSESVTT